MHSSLLHIVTIIVISTTMIQSAHSNPKEMYHNYDMSLITDRCVNAPPIENDYTPTGTNFVLNDMAVYETANKTIKRVLIAAYDIFGFHNSTKQVVDKLALGFGFKIAMPDYFHGEPWDINNISPSSRQAAIDFVDRAGNWNKSVKADILAVINHYRTTEGITEFGMFGFCWGAKLATQATIDIPELKAVGLVHPSLVTLEEAQSVHAPMYILPSKNEVDMIPFYKVIQQKFGNNSGHHRFDDMPHGFASARANFSDPLNRKRVDEVIDILGKFFDHNLVLPSKDQS